MAYLLPVYTKEEGENVGLWLNNKKHLVNGQSSEVNCKIG